MVARKLPRIPSRTLPEEGYAEIGLTRGAVAFVDITDFARISSFEWGLHVGAQRRAVRWDGPNWTYMHHQVLETTGAELKAKGLEVDHLNGNPLDNRRENLRICTHGENMRNSITRINNVGVMLHKPSGLWFAYINYPKRKVVSLGYWNTRERAVEINQLGKILQASCETAEEFKERWKEIRPRKPYQKAGM